MNLLNQSLASTFELMLTVTKNNPVVAEIDIFPVEPEQQQSLVDKLIEDIRIVFKQQPGFVAAAIHRSRDGQRVVNYVQWKSQKDYEAYINSEVPLISSRLSAFPAPNSRLYEVFISEPAD
ncbi:antibiotic biosynthesis monooxygenase family protein [Chlorogloeopsis sp. ULAP02]|uniref:antibiotic biosynthesis monooxygenase family protein n=1 Tax=Chlorogloeopsis sp. ULAP02 TaxID=3107926 RepID=UPI0031371A44